MASRHVDDFDDDGFDDDYDENGYGEGEGDELNPEDQAAMAEGTAEVRKALGPASSKVTLTQIQDALWHYYYDVGKSVAYLTKTYIAPAPAPAPKATPKPATTKLPEGMSNIFSRSAPYHIPPGEPWAGHQCSATFGQNLCYCSSPLPLAVQNFPTTPLSRPSLRAFFFDMPWLDVPESRKTVFIPPERPRGGLLGGGEGEPPMTKLQKLAAARKKKSEEKKENSKVKTTEEGLKKLSLSNHEQKDNVNSTLPSPKRQKLTAQLDASQNRSLQSSEDQKQALPITSAGIASPIKPPPTAPSPDEQDVIAAPPKATPSAFARTLCGPALDHRVNKTPHYYPMPYTLSPSFSRAAFDEPSPDDIVLAAQAKGSNFARTK